MVTVCFVPATVISMLPSSCTSAPGFTTNSPSLYPTCTPAIGPLNGASEIISAADAPRMLSMLGEQSISAERTVATICTSSLYPSGKRGRIGRSIIRALRMATSLGRPSRLKKPPGIFPLA